MADKNDFKKKQLQKADSISREERARRDTLYNILQGPVTTSKKKYFSSFADVGR